MRLPLDTNGNTVEVGKWYWGTKDGVLLGVGRIERNSSEQIRFFLGDQGRFLDSFVFTPAAPPAPAPVEAEVKMAEWPQLARWVDEFGTEAIAMKAGMYAGPRWLIAPGRWRTDEELPPNAERIDVNEAVEIADATEAIVKLRDDQIASLTTELAALREKVKQIEGQNGYEIAAQRRDERNELARQLEIVTAERDGLSNALNDVALGYTAAIKKFGLELKQKGIVA